MFTDLRYRNPRNYVRELIECDELNFAWDRGYLKKWNIDPYQFCMLYIGQDRAWSNLLIGSQGAALYQASRKPSAVYPVWTYGEPIEQLHDCIENPWGENSNYCDADVPIDERPVWGQDHVVVVAGLPPVSSTEGKNIVDYLLVLQEQHPDCTIYLHGLYSYKTLFGRGFVAGDVDGRTDAAQNCVITGTGMRLKGYGQMHENPALLRPIGFSAVDLKIPRNRCMFNIKSARWAALNWDNDYPTQVIRIRDQVADHTLPLVEYRAPRAGNILKRAKGIKESDRILCDVCSLKVHCSLYREGAVCTVPGADEDGKTLADMFRTRDSDTIINALGSILALKSDRVQTMVDREDKLRRKDPELPLDPAVDKMLTDLFKQGAALTKLVDPRLAGGAQVQIINGVPQPPQVEGANSKQFSRNLMAQIMASNPGISMGDITAEMIENHLANQKAIEGTVIESPEL